MKMYRLLKFTPRNCPHCNVRFENLGDWVDYYGQVVDGRKVPDPEFPRILCMSCKQLVKIEKLGEWQVKDKSKIKGLLEEGYFGLQEVDAHGSMARDFKIGPGNGSLKAIDCRTLFEIGLSYMQAKEAFDHCPDMFSSSSNIPPESKLISDRYFAERQALEEKCLEEKSNPLAQNYYAKAVLAHECADLLLQNESNSDECERRMREYDEAEAALLQSISEDAEAVYDHLQELRGKK